MRELVQEPMKATSIFGPRIGWFSLSSMNSRASVMPFCSSAGNEPTAGIRSLTPTDWLGLMPQVTVGSICEPSIVTRSSNSASGGEARLSHHAAARSKAAPCGAMGRPRR